MNSMKPPAIRISTSLVIAALGVLTVFSGQPGAFSLSGPAWPQAQTPYYINSANLDLAGPAAEAAVRAGADTWLLQAGAFRFAYAGPSSQTTNTNDQINLVLFRDAANGSAIATTYWWSSGTRIIDADIVFWDGGFTFFAGTTGCSGGFYIEDIAAHEFGHALGMGHSAVAGATMYPSVSSCNAGNRTLDPDDIAGVRSLYPPLTPPTPTGVRIVR
jgi:matrixin